MLLADLNTSLSAAPGVRRLPQLEFVQVPYADNASASPAVWRDPALSIPSGFTAAAFGDADKHPSATLPTDLDSMPDETPPGNKVPEPASLLLLGTGLLAVSCGSRMKRAGRPFARKSHPAISAA
jgi:PEP-CTERM motif